MSIRPPREIQVNKNQFVYRMSEHAIHRIKERFKDQLIEDKPVKTICTFFRQSKEDGRYLNNTSFMLKIQERHGYDSGYKFFIFENIVFICRGQTVVTVYDNKYTIFHNKNHTGRYRKKVLVEGVGFEPTQP
jgi:hypothetical protein